MTSQRLPPIFAEGTCAENAIPSQALLLPPQHWASRSQSFSRHASLRRGAALSPEILEPIGGQLGVAHRVLDVLVAEPSL
jgi:hypothetical protein